MDLTDDFTRVNMKQFQSYIFKLLFEFLSGTIKEYISNKLNTNTNIKETINNIFNHLKESVSFMNIVSDLSKERYGMSINDLYTLT